MITEQQIFSSADSFQDIAEKIIEELKAYADHEYAERETALNGVPEKGFIGVRKPHIRLIAKKWWQNEVKYMSGADIFLLCQYLVDKNIFELRAVAFDWAKRAKKHYSPESFQFLERWVNENIFCWIDCDDLCTGAAGEFLEKYPEFISNVLEWTSSQNRWVRRASAVSLIRPARNGSFLPEIFRISDALLTDSDDMVQKGYGWMLKVASQKHPDEVFSYVMENRLSMPRTSLRYAIEKFPPDMRKQAMKK
ncbi:DNA alkylation repair protein [Methanochimaera problematica]|uniref:DNA alkylation repair protein n=1 Tax=Methanochimaera problematica TaxID=2609417 RepID=UPI00293911AC|nr:DNA alkylation repair protein [Methanoplanus sp. FWC-SCC4]